MKSHIDKLTACINDFRRIDAVIENDYNTELSATSIITKEIKKLELAIKSIENGEIFGAINILRGPESFFPSSQLERICLDIEKSPRL